MAASPSQRGQPSGMALARATALSIIPGRKRLRESPGILLVLRGVGARLGSMTASCRAISARAMLRGQSSGMVLATARAWPISGTA